MNIKQRLSKLESSSLVKTESTKLCPTLSREQWLCVFGGDKSNIHEPFTAAQTEWVNTYGGIV